MRKMRFSILSGFLGVGIDFLIFHTALSKGVPPDLANISGFLASTVIIYTLTARGLCLRMDRPQECPSLRQHMTSLFIALLALFLRGGILANLINLSNWSPVAAVLPAIAGGVAVNCAGAFLLVFPARSPEAEPDTRWRHFALAVIAYTVLVRIVYIGLFELIYEEAYYWNYAMHPDIGYLDHPPMVAWSIWLTTAVLGNTEFAIRLGSIVFWLVTAFFSFRLTSDIFDRSAALRAVVLLSILPLFWGMGSIMAPDAPLMACWAGALFFLKRALLDDRRRAWWGVGICVGVGMLSKYTIALLGPSTLLFILLDRHARRWLRKPEPYVSVLVAFFLFLPVVLWNLQHDWASFTFQGPRRFQGSFDFSMDEWLGGVLLSLTPTGMVAVFSIVMSRWENRSGPPPLQETPRRRYHMFALVFALLPLSIFFTFALVRASKVNWTGPLWLAIIPVMAYEMRSGAEAGRGRLLKFVQAAWPPTIVLLIFIYGAGLYYLVSGIPGLPYPQGFSLLGYQNLARQIEQIQDEIEGQLGAKPLVAGMDKNKIASGLAFYRTKLRGPEDQMEKEAVLNTIGVKHLFGGNSLMYRYWFPEEQLENRDLILISSKPGDLTRERVLSRFRKAGPIRKVVFEKNGRPAGRYYYSLAEGYRGANTLD